MRFTDRRHRHASPRGWLLRDRARHRLIADESADHATPHCSAVAALTKTLTKKKST